MIVSVTLPRYIAGEIAERAEKAGMSRSEYVGQCLGELFRKTKAGVELYSDPLLQRKIESFLELPEVIAALTKAARQHFTEKQLALFEKWAESTGAV